MADRRRVAWWATVACIAAAALIAWSAVGFRAFAHRPSAGHPSTGSTAAAVSSPSPTAAVSSAIAGPPAKASPRLLNSVTTNSPAETLAFTPDGKTLAVRLGTGQVQLLNAATGAVRATLGPAGQSTDFNSALAISPDGKAIAIGVTPRSDASSSTVEEISVATGEVAASVRLSDFYAYSVAFSPDGKTLAIAGGRQLVFWNLVTHTTIAVSTDKANFMGDSMYASFSGDGKSLVVAGNDGLVQLWDVPAEKFSKSTTVSSPLEASAANLIKAAAISLDGGTVAVSGQISGDGADGTSWQNPATWLWHPATGKTVLLSPASPQYGTPDEISAQAFSPNGNLLATGDENGAIRLWDTTTGKLIASQHAPSPIAPVTAVAFAPDGRSLATAQSTAPTTTQPGTATIQFWDLYAASGQPSAETTSSPVTLPTLPPGTYRVAKRIALIGSWVVTLDAVQVAENGQATITVTTTNTSTSAGQLSCAGSPDPASASIVLATEQLVKSTSTSCPGYPDPASIPIPPQGFLKAYAVFANSRGLGQPFTFVWNGPDGLSGSLSGVTLSR